jgi:hypothetical protein
MPPVYAHYRVPPDTPVSLADENPADTNGYADAAEARAERGQLSSR